MKPSKTSQIIVLNHPKQVELAKQAKIRAKPPKLSQIMEKPPKSHSQLQTNQFLKQNGEVMSVFDILQLQLQ